MFLEAHRKLPGGPRRSQQHPGCPRRPPGGSQELPMRFQEAHWKLPGCSQEVAGGPQKVTRASQEVPEVPGGLPQQAPRRSPGGSQEVPGGQQGAPRRLPGCHSRLTRGPQEVPGCSQELPGGSLLEALPRRLSGCPLEASQDVSGSGRPPGGHRMLSPGGPQEVPRASQEISGAFKRYL